MLSYNCNCWRLEQEVKGSVNWMDLSKTKKWYKVTTKNHLADDFFSGLYYNEHGTAAEMLEYITEYYESLGYQVENWKKSKRCGYLIPACYGVVPYSGQWGSGWIVITHLTATTVCWNYIIIKGGRRNG